MKSIKGNFININKKNIYSLTITLDEMNLNYLRLIDYKKKKKKIRRK